MSAPIWRFTLGGGLAGKNSAMGVLMPSVDRVGRAFPLTLVTSMAPIRDVEEVHMAATPIFEELELVALDALDDGMTTAILGARLNEIPLLANRQQAALQSHQTQSSSIWSARLCDEMQFLRCAGLPDEDEIEGLFDLGAAIWKTNDQRIGAQT